MTTHSTTGHFKASPEALFAFLSDIENLPKWATGYCSDLKKTGSDYKVVTPGGEMFQTFKIDESTGTIDFYAGPTKDKMWCWPTRVTSDNMGGSVFAFTCVQMPDQDNNAFEGQKQGLLAEFENIRKYVE